VNQECGELIRVEVLPYTICDYTSMVIAGLIELREQGKIALTFRRTDPVRPNHRLHPHLVCLVVSTSRVASGTRLCIDLIDGWGAASYDELDAADVYVKRGYQPAYVNGLADDRRRKFMPFGLHYACRSRHETWRDALVRGLRQRTRRGDMITRAPDAIRGGARYLARHLLLALNSDRFTRELAIDQFENAPTTVVQQQVFFRTRVYAPDDAPGAHRSGSLIEVNDMRANTVRALQKAFGDRYVGGIRRTAYALSHYPDCMATEEIGHAGHIQVSRSSLINVSTFGLHDSTGWKLPEFIAASSCIVCEPPSHQIPEPLIDGKHYLGFASPEECVTQCDRLLSNPALAQQMRLDNYDYYLANLRPDRVMLKCIERALRRIPADQTAKPAESHHP
jgi:hypothetical protein